MNIETVASALKELGHPTRLGIYKLLVQAGDGGLPVGDVQKELQVPSSTLSHHIAALISVGLVKQLRHGRTLYCIAQYQQLNDIIAFLLEQCCSKEKNIHRNA